MPLSIDEIEDEVGQYKLRFEEVESRGAKDPEIWIHGWKKWGGEWTPRPIGQM